jgi:subtilisin family serine protease
VISVGATDDGGQIADFSSYGKVDVVAPGDCVAVAEVPGVDQDRGCPGDNRDGVAFNRGTSFSAPIVSGVLALAQSRSPLVARLALEASADGGNPGGASDAKQWAHGLADAGPSSPHDPDARRRGPRRAAAKGSQHQLGSGDGQLPPPGHQYVATPSRPTGGWPPTRVRPRSPAPPPAPPPSRRSTATARPSGPPWAPAT